MVREYTVPMRDPKHERLMPAIAETLGDVDIRDVDRMVCGAGPGQLHQSPHRGVDLEGTRRRRGKAAFRRLLARASDRG